MHASNDLFLTWRWTSTSGWVLSYDGWFNPGNRLQQPQLRGKQRRNACWWDHNANLSVSESNKLTCLLVDPGSTFGECNHPVASFSILLALSFGEVKGWDEKDWSHSLDIDPGSTWRPVSLSLSLVLILLLSCSHQLGNLTPLVSPPLNDKNHPLAKAQR